jgi:hypothetical protein
MIKFSNMVNENKQNFKPKLGLDLHGVVDSMPEFFAFLTNAIVSAGGEVHILTGGSWTEELEGQVKSYGITWTHKFSVYDHLIEIGSKTTGEIVFPDGTVQKKFENGAWDNVKGDYCREHNISLHIDDTLIYNDFFTTPYARLWSHSNNPKAPHKDVRHHD